MNSMTLLSHFRAFPEMLLLAGTCVLMIVDLYVKDERRAISFRIAQATLLLCFLFTMFIVSESEGTSRYIFYGLFVSDNFSNLLKLVAYIATSIALVYSRQYLVDRGLLRGEFVTLLLFSLLGMMVMMSANSFLTVYLGLELMSLCLYALVALARDSAAATEAAMKYFILGALSSGLLLYGMSMIYGATGSLDFREVSLQVSDLLAAGPERVPMRPFLVFGLVFVVAVSGLQDLAQDWQQMVAVLALLSMAIGNITAIAQSNLKRMLAYSTIAHMGFMLLGLLSGVIGGNRLNAADAYSAALFYIIVYTLMTLGSFGMLLFLSRAGFDCESLDDMRGLSRRSPWYAFVMMVIMFSLAGLPPTAGFYAKLAVLSAAVSAGQLWLAVAAVVLSLVGAFYYLRIVKLMYFDEPRDSSRDSLAGSAPVEGPREMRVLLSANGLILLFLGILPQTLMGWCLDAVQSLRVL